MNKLKKFEDYNGELDWVNDEEIDDVSMDTEVEDDLADSVDDLIDRFGLGKIANYISNLTR